MNLNDTWKVQGFEVGERRPLELAANDFDDRFWINTAVPADIHSIYIERKLIPDPYFGHQDQVSRFIEQKEWWYRKQFQYEPSKADEGLQHELIFEGLDTFAAIYMNGLEIGKAENMHRTYHFNVTKLLRTGKNTIAIRFDPLSLHFKDKMLFDWSSYTKERPWLRKAAMNWGWDWGPRMVTVGIWKDVRLESKQVMSITNVFAQTTAVSEAEAIIQVQTELRKGSGAEQYICRYVLKGADKRIVATSEAAVEQAQSSTMITVKHPQLWWTHDLGTPYLYTLEVQLLHGTSIVDDHTVQVGIRTIELQLENEQGEPRFQFVLNGVSLFAKGANWIPADHMIATISDERYTELITMATKCNMNMLRVWAGGIYEKDIFYEQCDRQGILVWQDFAFANTLFPEFNKEFELNVKAEIIDNVKRLRGYTSLAIWCGNNEIDWLYDMKSSEGSITSPFYGEAIYHEWIPELLEELDPDRPYWPSSPYGGSDANDPDVGDRHNWQVWHGSVYPRQFGEKPLLDYSVEGVSFKHYKEDLTLFSSEFGMHASANRYTLEKYIPEGEFYWGSAEMNYRNKDTNHQKGILLMEGYSGIPQNIEQYMNYSMLTQAEGLKYGIEHYRRHMHRTSGALIWQYNDSWPGTSWSLIDYLLLPKASYYYARKFFAPVLLTLGHEPNQPMQLYAVNDTVHEQKGNVQLTVASFTGEVLVQRSYEVNILAGSCLHIDTLDEGLIPSAYSPKEVAVALSSTNLPVESNYFYLRDYKDLKLPMTELDVQVNEIESTVTITANRSLARMVKLEVLGQAVMFADNYFDLLADEQRVISVARAEQPVCWDQLHVTALNSHHHVQS